MTERVLYNYLIIGWFILAGLIFVALFFIVAPYGRHATRNWGVSINNQVGWIIMESAAPIIFLICFVLGSNRVNISLLVFLFLWEAHYLHRAFIYPLSRRDGPKPMPILIVSCGFLFNAINGYLNGRYIFTFSGGYDTGWLTDPRFIFGVLLFITGYIINREADQALRNLRQPGESGYKVSNHVLFRWVSSPNYLGEIVIWVG